MANPWEMDWGNQQAPATPPGGMTVGTPKPKKPEVREVGGSLGIVGDDGSFTPTYTPPKDATGGSTTEGERKGGAFLKRALGAYQQYEKIGLGPRGVVNNVVNEVSPVVANNLPTWAGGNDPSRQQSTAAENEFLTAILRQDSGATITPDELEGQRRIYFPQPGEDGPEIIEAKRQARLRALEGLIGTSGGAADPEATAAVQQLLNPQPQAPTDNQTPNGTVIHDNSGATGNIDLSRDGTHTETNPALAGVNGQVNELIKQGASNGVILKLLKDRGADTQALMAVNQKLNEIRQFQKNNPEYNGDFQVDLERYDAPNTAWNNVAQSPLGAYAVAAGDTVTGGHLDNVVGAMGGDAEMANLGVQLSRQESPKASFAGDLTGGAMLYGAGAGALRAAGVPAAEGAVGAFAPRAIAGDAALGGYVASGQGGTQAVDLGNVAKGAALGAGVGAGTRGAFNTVGAAISPTGGDLAPLYEAGVKPTVGQRMGAGNWVGRSLNRMEQGFGSVPVAGGIQRGGRNAAVGEMQTGAFNQALQELKPFNEVLGRDVSRLPKGVKKGKQAHAFMQKTFDEAYDKARSGMQFAPDEQFAADVDALAPDVGMLFPQSQAVVKNLSNEIGAKVRASGGNLNGDQFKIIVSRLGKKIGALRSQNGGDTELADVLESMKTAIEDAARRQSDPAAVRLLDAADAGYAKAVIIENAGRARGGEAGEFNGTQLDAAVQRTDKSRRSRAYLRGEANMQKYGEAAKKLGDELPDSGSAERILAAGGLASLAHFASPLTLAPWAADTIANAPGIRQGLSALMAPRSEAIRPYADKGRTLFELLGRYGAPVAVSPATTPSK